MYDKKVIEPRLTAGWDTDVDGADMPAALRAISAALSQRYDIGFDRIWINLYRDGRDSVAWHGDRNRHTHRNPLRAPCHSAVAVGSSCVRVEERRSTSCVSDTGTWSPGRCVPARVGTHGAQGGPRDGAAHQHHVATLR